jgi:hypothetical protein
MKMPDIFEKAGGSIKIALKVNCNQYAVEQWLNRGIPHKHWSKLLKAFKWLTLETLHNANEEVRNESRANKG